MMVIADTTVAFVGKLDLSLVKISFTVPNPLRVFVCQPEVVNSYRSQPLFVFKTEKF
jgi:hypothetical protein